MKHLMKFGLIALILSIVLAQVVKPVDRDNPPVVGDIGAPAAVDAVLRTSCYDCHSNETAWPWYSYLFPASWLLQHDVEEGREHLNFSDWSTYGVGKQDHKLEELVDEVESGSMPLDKYLYLHRGAKLTGEQKTLLVDWAQAARAALEDANPAQPGPEPASESGN